MNQNDYLMQMSLLQQQSAELSRQGLIGSLQSRGAEAAGLMGLGRVSFPSPQAEPTLRQDLENYLRDWKD